MQDLKEKIETKYLKYILIIIAFFISTPSIIYFIKNRTVLNFNGSMEFRFLLTKDIDRLYQAMVYTVLILAFIICYYLILKYRNKIFSDIKKVYSFILIISIIFVLLIPFWCSDVFYYMGIGRLNEKYKQNPYYIDMQSYIDNNKINIENDTVIQKGYNNYWGNTTVVYGAFWTIICSIVSFLSIGNLDLGLLIFKIIAVLIHLGNCILLYKISNRKFFTLAYGINPFILIEGIGNVHNDLFVIFFILLSLYFVIKKQKILFAILFLALATAIKYFPILFLPYIIIYHYKNKDVKTRIVKCVGLGIAFVILVLIPYLLYIKDISVFMGLITQQDKIAKGIYIVISQYFNNPPNLVSLVKKSTFLVFVILYAYKIIQLLINNEICIKKEMQSLFKFILIFLFLMITNFQPWYLIWITPFMMWEKSENIKLIIQMQLMTLIANIVFLIYSENYKYGVPFFMIYVIGTLLCIIRNKNEKIENGVLR